MKYGEYLVTLAGCMGCHTPSKQGKPLKGLTLAGGEVFRLLGHGGGQREYHARPADGIGRWSEQDFLDRIYQYKEYVEKGSPHTGPESFTLMPWLNFAQLEPEDLKAIYAFLRTEPPVYHVVDSHPVWQAQESRKKPRG